MDGPSKRQKYLFWILLGFLSCFFAEVISGSYPYPFTTIGGYILLFPLYTLHLLILASLCYRRGTPRFSTLFLAGCIFGMYEAYITKVLWNPPWAGPGVLKIAEVAVVELVVIAWFWHPFMAFIVPLMVGGLLVRNKALVAGLPPSIHSLLKRRYSRVVLIAAIWAGLVQGAQMGVVDVIASILIALTALLLLARIFDKQVGRGYSMRQLLPNKKQTKKLLVLLIIYYAISGIIMRPENFPGLLGHISILLIYAALFWLLNRNLKGLTKVMPVRRWRPRLKRKSIARASAIYIVIAAIVSLSGIGMVFLIASYIIWAVIAIYCMEFSVKDTIKVSRENPQK